MFPSKVARKFLKFGLTFFKILCLCLKLCQCTKHSITKTGCNLWSVLQPQVYTDYIK